MKRKNEIKFLVALIYLWFLSDFNLLTIFFLKIFFVRYKQNKEFHHI